LCFATRNAGTAPGYPSRSRGYQIPLGARLFALADTFDALTSDRVYRRSASCEEARQVIAQGSRPPVRSRVVNAFMDVPVEEWEAIRGHVFEEVALRRCGLTSACARATPSCC
jgi:response regulator RpfG family c-di-GMP phosphodiesterase